MQRKLFAALLLALTLAVPARAAFDVPYEKPALAISVPGRWNPNHSDIGVDAAAPDNALFFSIYVMTAKNAQAVQADSVAMLKRNGMTLDEKSVRRTEMNLFAGLVWVQSDYAATEDGKPRMVRVEAAPLPDGRYVQLAIWGTPQGFTKNAAALKSILATIKLKKTR